MCCDYKMIHWSPVNEDLARLRSKLTSQNPRQNHLSLWSSVLTATTLLCSKCVGMYYCHWRNDIQANEKREKGIQFQLWQMLLRQRLKWQFRLSKFDCACTWTLSNWFLTFCQNKVFKWVHLFALFPMTNIFQIIFNHILFTLILSVIELKCPLHKVISVIQF